MQIEQPEPAGLSRRQTRQGAHFQRLAGEERARADRAEQAVRDIAKSREEWRRRAVEAEAALAAMGGL